MMRDKPPSRGFILGASAVIIACIVIALLWQVTNGCYTDRPALGSFYVAISTLSDQKEIAQGFQQFADENGFSFSIDYYTPDHRQLSIDLVRGDAEVFATNVVPAGPAIYHVSFYNNNCVKSTTAAGMAPLVDSLRALVGSIPGAKVTIEP